MVAFTALVSAISMALLATTASAVPTALAARQAPPTSSAMDFTLYKATQPGAENECWTGVDIVHVAPADIGTCNKADFYVLRIDHLATGYNCQVNVYDDDSCLSGVGGYTYSTDYSSPCQFPSSSGLVDLKSWSVSCH